MSGVPRTPVRGSPPTGGGDRARIPPDELRARRHGGDFSHIGSICTESNRPPSTIPDFDDLPSIPSTSTGLWGDDAPTISTEMMGSPTASPIVGCLPLPIPSHLVCERPPLTEAQKIVVRYRQRCQSSRVREDGTVACDREDCLAILPNLRAFSSHLDIHLIHEGYVIHLGSRIGY